MDRTPSTPSRTSSEPGKSNSEKKENENKYIPPSPLHVILYTILLSLDQEYHQTSRFTETQLNTLLNFSVFFITELFQLVNYAVFPQAIFTIFSAGPYSGKSWLLDEILSSYENGILIDPDRLLVLLIKHGFNVNLQSTKPEIIIGEDKYKYFQRCMDFANYSNFRRWLNTLTEVLINYYLNNNVNVFSPQIIDVENFQFLKPIQERGIKILLVFIYASDDIVSDNRKKREKEIAEENNKKNSILQAALSQESFYKLTTKHKHSSSPEGILKIKDGLPGCNIIKVSVTKIGLVYRYIVRCDDNTCDDTTYDAKEYIISYLISYLTSISKDTSPLSHLTCSLEE